MIVILILILIGYFLSFSYRESIGLNTIDKLSTYVFINTTLNKNENREKKLKTVYKKLLGTCLHKIQILNDRDETDMVYNVPQIYYGFSKYEPFDCLTYIEKKLRKKYLDTYILSETKIFISWKNIEENKKIQKELDN